MCGIHVKSSISGSYKYDAMYTIKENDQIAYLSERTGSARLLLPLDW